MATKKDIEKILRKAEGKKVVKKKVVKKPAKKKASTTKKWPSGIPKSTKKQRAEAKNRNQTTLERMAAAERARLGGRSFVEYDHNPSEWRDSKSGEYRYIPNLDSCDDEELLVFMESLAFDDDPIMLMASEYAKHKLLAQRSRRKGDIQTAQGHETHCDRIYVNIPQQYRW